MSDLLKLLFDLGQLGHEFSHLCGDLPDSNSGLGLEAKVVCEKPCNRAAKGFRDGIEAIERGEDRALLVSSDGSFCYPKLFGQSANSHARGYPSLLELFLENFCCSHPSIQGPFKPVDKDSRSPYSVARRPRKWLRESVRNSGLTQERLAFLCGVDPRTVRHWMTGRSVSGQCIQALARVLGPGVLLGFFLENLITYLEENNEQES